MPRMVEIPLLQEQPVLTWPQKQAVQILERMERRLQQERQAVARFLADAEATRRERRVA